MVAPLVMIALFEKKRRQIMGNLLQANVIENADMAYFTVLRTKRYIPGTNSEHENLCKGKEYGEHKQTTLCIIYQQEEQLSQIMA
jgi:hypothetical protein